MYLARPSPVTVLFYSSFGYTRILDQGRTIDAIIADRCEGCKNPLDIDMSIGVISVLNPGYTGNLLKYVFDGRIYGVVWKIY